MSCGLPQFVHLCRYSGLWPQRWCDTLLQERSPTPTPLYDIPGQLPQKLWTWAQETAGDMMKVGGQRPPAPESLFPWGKDDTPILLAFVPELREDVAKWQVFLFRYPKP